MTLNKNIFFTGFMASGKSRIGEQTARVLGWVFLDTDKLIEEKVGSSVSQIFSEQGETAFRQMEIEVLREIIKRKNCVIALGGGTLTHPEAVAIIKENGTLVRLWAPVDVISERIARKNTRPLMAGLSEDERKAKIREMLARREPFYNQADFSIESHENIPVDQLVKQMMELISAWDFKKVHVDTAGGKYPIFIGTGVIERFDSILTGLESKNEYLVVSDDNVAVKQADRMALLQKHCNNARFFRFAPGEEFKNLQTLNRLFTFMLRKGYTRKTTLIQFSGGVVGDMAGFGAATYQRGIPFIQVPTTLLSMVDSSVGGKVAVNHQMGKNMIGAFYQPQAVIIDLNVLQTLPQEEYISGLCEVVKYGIIWDRAFFEFLENNVAGILRKDTAILEKMISRCCAIKAEVVSKDERENDLRAILNYGHTFAHAIETQSDYKYSHGLAVGLGMRVAARLSSQLNLWGHEHEKRQNALLDALGVPKTYAIDKEEAWESMAVDKKAEKGVRVFVLPTRIGGVQKFRNPPKDLVFAAWDAIL